MTNNCYKFTNFFSYGAISLTFVQVSNVIVKELKDNPKVYIWDGAGNFSLLDFE